MGVIGIIIDMISRIKQVHLAGGNVGKRGVLFLFIFGVGLILFIPFQSISLDLNSIDEAIAVQQGSSQLFDPNHALYRLIGRIVFDLVQLLGYSGKLYPFLQGLTSVLSALGLGFFALFLYEITASLLISAVTSIFFATTWSYWTFSTDVYYITPTLLPLCASLYFLWRGQRSPRKGIWVGLFFGLSVLSYKAIILLLPVYLVFIWAQGSHYWKDARSTILAFSATLVTLLCASYLLFAFWGSGISDLGQFVHWIIGHTSNSGGRPKIWGALNAHRVVQMVYGYASSLIPFWEGLGLPDLLHGIFHPEKIWPQLSLVALISLGLYTLYHLVRSGLPVLRLSEVHLLLGATVILSFILWWDPTEPKWYVIPNVFILSTLASIWSRSINKRGVFLIATCALVIAAANFTATIWPRHTQENPKTKIAQCFTQSTTEKDAYFIGDWAWFGYAIYLYDYRGEFQWCNREANSAENNLHFIDSLAARAHERGGEVYMTQYPPDQAQWVKDSLGCDLDLIAEQYQTLPSFSCTGVTFVKLKKQE